MGTTKDAIENGDNPILAFVLAIEGEVTLITSWSDTAAVVTAWSGTNFTAASAGLERPGEISQTLSPFRPSIESDSTTFVIHGGENDTFAERVFAKDKTGGAHARMDASVDADDTTISTQGSGDFGASGAAFVGTERFTYGSILNDDFNVTTRGIPAPFAINGGATFGRAHRVSQVAGARVQYPYVTDYPRKWIGKWIGCWVHRVVGDVLDTKAQAQLIFAGKIADIRDGVSSGKDVTLLDCTDTREAIKSAVLLGDQFSAVPKEGVRLTASDSVRFQAYGTDFTTSFKDDEELVVGATAYGAVHIATGYNTSWQIWAGIGFFLSDAFANADLTAEWRISRRYYDEGPQRIEVEALAVSNIEWLSIQVSMSPRIAGMLGFDIEDPDGTDDGLVWIGGAPLYEASKGAATAAKLSAKVVSSFGEAYSLSDPLVTGTDTTLMEEPTGTWVNQQADLPKPWSEMTTTPDTSSGSWGFFDFGGRRALLAKRTSDTEFTLYGGTDLDTLFGYNPENLGLGYNRDPRTNSSFIRLGEPVPRYRQVVIIRNDFDYIINRIFASTGAATYNHATYDAWDYQLSADGGIPWDLLGDNFLNTSAHLAAFTDTATMTLFLEKPTKLEDVLLPELSLRNAHLMLKDGGLVFATPSQPSTGLTEHSITTSHKAADPDSVTADWPDYELSRNTIITHIKVKYNRTISGEYRDEVDISNEQSKSDHGTSEPITIEARNSIDVGDGAGDVVSQLINGLAADALAYYNKPLPVASRSLSSTKFFITPGLDRVSVTDNFLRTASTGQRGLSAVPAWTTGIAQDWSKMRGTIQMVLLEEDDARRVIYSPAAIIDVTKDGGDWDKGYNSTNSSIWLVENEFSLASENDDVTQIDDGDKLTVIERSPATPGSPVMWDRTVSSTSGNEVIFTSGLSSPAWDNTLQYYVVSQDRTTAQTSQQSDCYTGDDLDGKIADDVRNRIWTNQAPDTATTTAAVQTTRHEYPPTDGEYWTEDQPVHPAMHRNLISSANNLIGYRTAPQMIMALDLNNKIATTQTSYVACSYPIRYYLGRGRFDALKRILTVGVAMQQTTGGTGSVRVTTSAFLPQSTDAIGTAITLTFPGPINQLEFTNTTTANIVNVAAQTIDVVPSPGHQYTWVTVECKTSANTSTFFGFHEFFLGPLAS